MKKTVKFALQQFGLHAAGMIAALFLVPVYGSLWTHVEVFQWLMTACVIAILAILLYLPAANLGVKDCMHDELLDRHGSAEPRLFQKGRGFLAGLLSQVPALVLLALSLLLPAESLGGNLTGLAVKGWYFMFSRFFNHLGLHYAWVALFGAAFSTVVSGLAYANGKEMRLRTKIVMERNDKKRQRAEEAKRKGKK